MYDLNYWYIISNIHREWNSLVLDSMKNRDGTFYVNALLMAELMPIVITLLCEGLPQSKVLKPIDLEVDNLGAEAEVKMILHELFSPVWGSWLQERPRPLRRSCERTAPDWPARDWPSLPLSSPPGHCRQSRVGPGRFQQSSASLPGLPSPRTLRTRWEVTIHTWIFGGLWRKVKIKFTWWRRSHCPDTIFWRLKLSGHCCLNWNQGWKLLSWTCCWMTASHRPMSCHPSNGDTPSLDQLPLKPWNWSWSWWISSDVAAERRTFLFQSKVL